MKMLKRKFTYFIFQNILHYPTYIQKNLSKYTHLKHSAIFISNIQIIAFDLQTNYSKTN